MERGGGVVLHQKLRTANIKQVVLQWEGGGEGQGSDAVIEHSFVLTVGSSKLCS
jgi:hypothetical protein